MPAIKNTHSDTKLIETVAYDSKKGSWWFCPNHGEQKAMGWIVTTFFTIKILDIPIEIIQSASKDSHWAFLGWFIFYTFGISVGVSATIRASKRIGLPQAK